MQYNPQLAFQPLPEQRRSQDAALQQLLAYLQAYSPFYQKLFAEHKTDITKIKGLSDMHLLPTTSKSDMQLSNWDFLCVHKEQVAEYTATSGTLGQPVTIALTANDLQRLAYNEQQSFKAAGGRTGDVYQLMLTLDRQFMAGMAYYQGIRQLGASVVRTGPGLPAMQWDTINRLKTTSIVTVPSFILKLIDHARQNGIDLKESSMKSAVCIGENLRNSDFSLNTLGELIAKDWPIRLHSTYASTEMQTAFTECEHGNGGHHQPELLIMEILDDSGNPLSAGEYGELVITTLGIEGMPLLRYRTGDICAYYDAPCACGRHSLRLSPVKGRKQQMIKYRGTTLYPPAIFDMLNNVSFIKEYIVEVFTGELGTDELLLHIHTQIPVDDCERQLKPLLQSKLRVSPWMRFHSGADMAQMQFPIASRKQVKFVDNRK